MFKGTFIKTKTQNLTDIDTYKIANLDKIKYPKITIELNSQLEGNFLAL